MIVLAFHIGSGYSSIEDKNTFAEIKDLKKYLDKEFDYLVQFAECESFECSDNDLEEEAQKLWDATIEVGKTKRKEQDKIKHLQTNIKYVERWFAELDDTIAKRQEELIGYRTQLEAAQLAFNEKYDVQS